jgi:hypothetical protein
MFRRSILPPSSWLKSKIRNKPARIWWQTKPVKSSIFSYIMPCNNVADGHRHFRGKYCLHLQDQRLGQVSNQQEAGRKQSSVFLAVRSNCSVTTEFPFVRSLNKSGDKKEL